MTIQRKGDQFMTQIYNLIAIISFSLAVIGLGATAYIWFKYKIIDIINDLSGKTARRSIAQLRTENEKSGIKIHRASIEAYNRGKITEEIEKIKESPPPKSELRGTPTEKLGKIGSGATDVLATEELAAAVREQTSGKIPLSQAEEEVNGTVELTGEMETEQLMQNLDKQTKPGKLKILQEIVKTHTDEKI